MDTDMRDNTEDLRTNEMHVALCPNRHGPIERANGVCVTDFIFPHTVEEPMDFLSHDSRCTNWVDENAEFLLEPSNKLFIYVPGLTPLVASFLLVFTTYELPCMLSLMHKNTKPSGTLGGAGGPWAEQGWN